MNTKDLFSGHANLYAAFRPTYPKALYDFVFQHVKHFDAAWDAGTGNGQVARDLAGRFSKVFATDISDKQLANAPRTENIFYSVEGEKTSFEAQSFNLITVAQAIHWFDIPRFYAEVRRVAQPDCLLAVWGYSLLSVSPPIDEKLHHFYTKIVGPYWDKERKLIDECYSTIPFPFEEIRTPDFDFSFQWKLNELQGYLNTWSSVQKYIQAGCNNPVPEVIHAIAPFWVRESMKVSFPLFLRLGKIIL